ncbi:carnitine operon protein CaiE [Providencia stuartii]|nr:carnitine operon protein CaiE [Providencia stuartii]
MPFYQIDGITPVVSPESFVHPTAVIIGDVIIGKKCLYWP